MDRMEDMEVLISNVLRIGVLLSGFIIFIGMILIIVTGDTSYPFGDMNIAWIVWGDPFFAPSHILFIGYLILIATPILRIVASIIIYVKNGDNLFSAITTIVLLIRLVSFTLGMG